jgi:hypothetical protein
MLGHKLNINVFWKTDITQSISLSTIGKSGKSIAKWKLENPQICGKQHTLKQPMNQRKI